MRKHRILFVTVMLLCMVPFLFAKPAKRTETVQWAGGVPENWEIPKVSNANMQAHQTAVVNSSRIASRSVVGTTTYLRALCYGGRSIVKGADGTLHAAWCSNVRQSDPAADIIRYMYYAQSKDNGETWSEQIKPYDTWSGWRCSIAAHLTDPNIIAIAFSAEPNQGDTRRMHATVSLDGGVTWQPSKNVCGSLLNIENPSILFDNKGGLHVAYECNADNRTYWNFSADNGKTWLAQPEQIDIGSSLLAAFGPVLAIDKNNNAHVAWCDGGTAGNWLDKEVYWNYRDMDIGIWMEVPPPRIEASSAGTAIPSFVFDSKGVGHLVADGIGADCVAWYRSYKNGVWSAATRFDGVGGISGVTKSTFYSSIAVDKNDVLYLTYSDNTIPGGSGYAAEPNVDIFCGTNKSGDWEVVNLTADGPDPMQAFPDLAAQVSDDGSVHLIFAEGTTTRDEGNRIIHMVAYPWPEEPTCLVSSFSDTYNKTGPFTVSAQTSDIKGFVTGVKLFVLINGVQVQEMDMEKLAEDSYEATFEISGNPGDEVSYYGKAVDNEGYEKISPIGSFKILQPEHPEADLLLVYQNVYDKPFLTGILDKYKYNYELWDYDDHDGIDASVTNFGWKAIFVSGWGVSCVPTGAYTENPFGAFLQSATTESPKYLCLASQDYIFANGAPTGSTTFNAGDFAYDFLQLGEGISDPFQIGDTTHAAEIPGNDSLLVGIEGDPISGSFSAEPLRLCADLAKITYNTTANPNWMDYSIATGEGEDIFFSYNQGFGSGIKFDAGNFKTVYLPWNVDMILDSVLVDTAWTGQASPQAEKLVYDVLKWFTIESGVTKPVDSAIPKQFALGQNYPNPFNPATSIRIALPRMEQVDIAIYNALGQKIRTLISKKMVAGNHVAVWDGCNDAGQLVSTGIYFYSMKAGDFSQTKKMIVIK